MTRKSSTLHLTDIVTCETLYQSLNFNVENAIAAPSRRDAEVAADVVLPHERHFCDPAEVPQSNGKCKGCGLLRRLLSLSAENERLALELSQRQKSEQRLIDLAFRDPLTGLPNRRLLTDRMELAIAQANRSGQSFSLWFLDLNGFKQINDTFGHKDGDKILIEVAGRLSSCVRKIDTVARLGGDEFVILAPSLIGKLGISRLASKIASALRAPYRISEKIIVLDASIGYALYPDHGNCSETLMQFADMQMYATKRTRMPMGNSHHSMNSDIQFNRG